MTRELRFTVIGISQTKGSARAFVITPKGGGKARAIVTNDNPKAKGWQTTIANCASLELGRAEHRGLFFEGAVALEVTFYLPRPKRFLTRTYASKPVAHTTRPDADKALRVVKDALSNVVWHDDAQVTDVIARKRYCAAGEFPRVEILVRDAELEDMNGKAAGAQAHTEAPDKRLFDQDDAAGEADGPRAARDGGPRDQGPRGRRAGLRGHP
jgi:Holliday junction resolvase RusA-like endonuclease